MRLPPFSHNPRREIGKHSKIYFLDLGIRNALIGDFNDLSIRPDRGAVWENFLIIERIKTYLNQGRSVQSHFWRTYGGAEVDYIEEGDAGQIQAYEIKFGSSVLTRGNWSIQKTTFHSCLISDPLTSIIRFGLLRGHEINGSGTAKRDCQPAPVAIIQPAELLAIL
jgi:predicted AAA+ superfamily ATPase